MTTSEYISAIADGADRFARAAFGPARARALAGRDDEALRRAGEEGWLALLAPEDAGGAGQGLMAAFAVAEAFGRTLAPFSYAACAAAVQALSSMGAAMLDEVMSGRALVAPAIASGADAGVEARVNGGVLRLNGVRRGVVTGGAADAYLIEATLDGAPVLALVKAGAAGLRVTSRRTVDGLDVADLHLEACVAEAGALTGDVARAVSSRLHATLAVLVSAELLGLCDVAQQMTLEHLKTRRQFGKPLASFQALQFKAVDAYVGVALARSLTSEAARLADEGSPDADVAAASAKAKTSEAAITMQRAAVQMHGAIGFSDEYDIGLYLKRALALSVAWGHAAFWRKRLAARLVGADSDIRFRADKPEDAAFRKEVRAWLEAELPHGLRNLPTRPAVEDAIWWHRKLHARGWVAPNWPKEYGGMGASVAQQIILSEEFGAIGAPEMSGQAIHHLGPIMQSFGTPEQKARFLPAMVSGEAIWCQGYSEPGSGSDLASLRTRAVREGDDFIVNGSKIWTTWAHHAHWMFALVRTNPDVKKQEGITFLLIDMASEGITRRPIRTIAGEDEFAEVFFDNVRVPASNVIGAVDDGWRVANAVLEKERLNGGNPTKCAQLLTRIKQAARQNGLLDDESFRDRLVRAEIDFTALCATYAQIVTIVETGSRTKGDFAFAKLVAGELQQTLCELLMEACGADAASEEPIELGGASVTPGVVYLQARRVTIYGGSSEVQRLLIARRVLGLGLSS